MSESCFCSIVHRDFHKAMMAKKDAEIEALRAEIATPVLVATNRLADALADARAEITKLQEGIQSDQERLATYGEEIAKLRKENARVKNLDMDNIVNASKLEAEIAKLRAEREELQRRVDGFRDEFLEKALEWRGISFMDEACDGCGGSGVVAYGSTATWHGGIGGQAITNGVCDKCWGSGSKVHKGADLRKLSAALAEKGE